MATRNRYAEIMAQYAQSQPFSFFGYPESYSGGYDVAQPQAYATPANRYEEIMAQPTMGGGGRGIPEAPSAWSLMTPAERAAYYRERPIEGTLALGAQDLFGNFSLLGQVSKNVKPDAWYNYRLEKQGYDPEQFAYGPPDPNFNSKASAALAAGAFPGGSGAPPSGGFVAVTPQQAAAEAAAVAQAAQAAEAARQPIVESRSGGGGGMVMGAGAFPGGSGPPPSGGRGGGGGYGGGEATGGRDTGGGARDASGGGDRGTRGGFAYGGYVSMQDLQGPNPEGPDDGYAALKDGEFVINDQAVNQYGIELMNLINSGKISKGELRGLLEM